MKILFIIICCLKLSSYKECQALLSAYTREITVCSCSSSTSSSEVSRNTPKSTELALSFLSNLFRQICLQVSTMDFFKFRCVLKNALYLSCLPTVNTYGIREN